MLSRRPHRPANCLRRTYEARDIDVHVLQKNGDKYIYLSYMCPCKTPSHDQPLFNCTVLVLINEAQNWTLDTA